MDRDSPIEYSGNAHLVTVTCPGCDYPHTVDETTAGATDGNVLCTDCAHAIENLWSDLYVNDQIRRLRVLSEYMKSEGLHLQSKMVQTLAQDLQKYEPIVHAMEDYVSGDISQSRESLQKQIDRYAES